MFHVVKIHKDRKGREKPNSLKIKKRKIGEETRESGKRIVLASVNPVIDMARSHDEHTGFSSCLLMDIISGMGDLSGRVETF